MTRLFFISDKYFCLIDNYQHKKVKWNENNKKKHIVKPIIDFLSLMCAFPYNFHSIAFNFILISFISNCDWFEFNIEICFDLKIKNNFVKMPEWNEKEKSF